MPTHIVEQGESIQRIARDYGFADWRTIWEHGANASLRQRRSQPEVLFPGDVVEIPEREPTPFDVVTDRVHRFYVNAPDEAALVVVAKNAQDEPIANTPWVITVTDGPRLTGTTDAEGTVRTWIPILATQGTLTVGGYEYPLRFSELDPIATPSGFKARLFNLGYTVGSMDGPLDEVDRAAIREFQRGMQLDETGEPDGATRTKLKERYGC